MINIVIMVLSNVLNINFTNLSHPVSIVIRIILPTILVGLITGTIMESFWLPFYL